jgi:PhoPQ-activated pathogenicity-related protein
MGPDRKTLAALAVAAVMAPALSVANVLLDDVERPAEGFGYSVRDGGEYRGATWVELTLTSQTWRGIPWRHQLYIVRPGRSAPGPRQALLFVDGGKWRPEYEQPPLERTLPRRADVYVDLATSLASPVVVLRQVPNQPLFDGLTEDALIAYTLDQYLSTSDPDWPLLLPMVRSVTAAMDAAGRFAADHWSIRITGYTLTGASKRAWTTWLTAAVDERVRAVAPMVFDVLNMRQQVEHQRESWGALSEQIADYSSRNLTERLGTPEGAGLAAIIDPYSYRERLVQPKIVILGTNDRYWPVDAARLYWDGLPGERYAVYLPNQGHKPTDVRRIVAGLKALHRHSAGSTPLPDLKWQWREDGDRLTLTLTATPAPAKVRAWVAKSDSRDLREAHWRAFPMQWRKGSYMYSLRKSPGRYLGLYGEAVFGRGDSQVFLSTLPAVAPAAAGDGIP